MLQQVLADLPEPQRLAFVQAMQQQAVLAAKQEDVGPGPGSEAAASAAAAALDPGTWKKQVLYPKLWELILTTLSPADAAILTKAFPEDWNGYGSLSRMEVAQGLRRLTRAERDRLPAIMEYVEEMERSTALVSEVHDRSQRRAVLRRRRRAAQMGMGMPDEEDEDGTLNPLFSLLGLAAPGARDEPEPDEPAVAGTKSGYFDREQQPGASTSTSSASALPRALQERLGHMVGTYERYVQDNGWEAETQMRQSMELRNLIRMQQEMCQLSEGSTLPLTRAAVASCEARKTELAQEVYMVIAGKAQLKDPAARAVVRYLETQLIQEGQDGAMALACDSDSVARFGQFIVAAQNWEAYRAFLYMYSAKHRELQLEAAMEAAGMSDGTDWWVAVAYDEPTAAAAGASGSGPGPGSSGSGVRVDLPKVEAIACLDVDSLQFLTELESSGYSEEVFMKWYFHPVMGPRMRSGAFLDPNQSAAAGGTNPAAMLMSLLQLAPGMAVPEVLQQVMDEAMAGQDGQQRQQQPQPWRQPEQAEGRRAGPRRR